jgi:CRP/FNR family transcriptional regulator, anaerobic regulatory protein
MIRCTECVLRRRALFHEMSGRDVAAVGRMKRDHMGLAAGKDLIREGGNGQTLYTLFEGWALRYHRRPDGSRQILDVLLPGDMVGMTSLLLGRSAHSVQALTEARFCVLDGTALPELFKKNPDLAFALTRTWVADARRGDLRVTMLGRMTAAERVGYFLIEIYDRLRQRGMARGGVAPCPLRGIDVADAVGLSRVHVMRALKELRAESLLDRERGNLIIPEFARLAEFTGYTPASRAGKRAII